VNQSIIKLKFEVSKLDNQSMSIEFNNGEKYHQIDNNFIWQSTIIFPCVLDIKVYGKGPSDTIVDDQGNIQADKYVKLVDIIVDCLPCAPYYVHKVKFITEHGQEMQSNFWGFNGTARLEFMQANSFYWSTHTQNVIYDPQ
jgi:hypothetical protein